MSDIRYGDWTPQTEVIAEHIDATQARKLAATLDRPRIVQLAAVCQSCYVTGMQGGHGTFAARGWTDGPTCSACAGLGARHAWGLPMDAMGAPVEQRVLARPEVWMSHAWLDRLAR